MANENPQGGHESGAVLPTKRSKKKPQMPPPKILPPWKVLLHNDDINNFDDVVKTIRQITALNEADAVARTDEAQKQGVALLLVTHRERAELYVEQFQSAGLTTTAEPEA